MKQIGRVVQNPNSKACPRWLQNQPTSTGVCNVTSCHAKVHANTRLGTPSEIEQLLAVKVEAFTVLETTSTVGLRREHYNTIYRELHPKQPCGSCGALPGRGESTFSRKCPDPETINTHLNRISGENKIIKDETRICLPCYKYCISIIHNKEDPQADVNITVYDIIKELDMKIQEYHTAPAETKSKYDLLELASTSCSKNLAIHLANDQAVLLSTVHNDFVHEVEHTSI